MDRWEPDFAFEPPPWLIEGARVRHATFGKGKVGRVGQYKDVPTVWIDFESGHTKALALEIAVEFLEPLRPNRWTRLLGRDN